MVQFPGRTRNHIFGCKQQLAVELTMARWREVIRKPWQSLRVDCRGAMAVEFGFAMPVLILFTVGIIDFSMLVWSASTIENAASEGARYAVVNGGASVAPKSAAEIETYIRTQAVGVPATALNVGVTWLPDNRPGARVTVALDYTHNFLIGGLIGLDPVSITKTSRMIVF
jgi:Flp pilus assembly protein TadG